MKIKQRAGNRYTPELNVDLPISDNFDGISRTKEFYNSIRKHTGKLNRGFNRISSKYDNKEMQKLYDDLQYKISELLIDLNKLKEYNSKVISWKKTLKAAKKAEDITWKILDKLREKKDKTEQQKPNEKHKESISVSDKLNSNIHYIYEIQKELRYFNELSSSTKAKLSNIPFLLLTGRAGTGKTHLLCDIIESRITGKKQLPAILVFGELFTTSEDPFIQIIKQLELKLTKNQFLKSMNKDGKQSGCRAIIAIDALNETKKRNFWKRNLRKVVEEINKYPNIALVVSVRTGFEEEVLTKKIRKTFVQESHRGFEFREWEAVNKFFKEFSIPLPEIPLLLPEFREPLFLLLFCAAFGNKNKDLSLKTKKQLKKTKPFKGHIGATHIFESFIKQAADKIASDFNLPKGRNSKGEYVIWDTVIKKFAEKVVEQNNDSISESHIVKIINNAYPAIDHNQFIKELDRNLLLVKVPKYSMEKKEYDGYDFRFPFQKFSDHLIGRYIFKKYEEEFGVTNKGLETAKKYFSKRRKLGKFLSKSWNRGIVEAVSIQCPEHLKGYELIDVAPYLKGSYVAQEAFVESLIWRNPTAFSTDTKNTLAYINKYIINTESGLNNLLNALLTVASIPSHPFNANFLHLHLSKFSMADRDSWWSTFLHYQYSEKNAVDRMIEWGWSEQDKTHINDKAIQLCAITLLWFLTTPNRFLRDKSTKALVTILTDRLNIVINLLILFKDINDPYVSERLYAVAYGCVIRSRKDKDGLKRLSVWVYTNVFKNENPPTHILLRDYARGIIETTLYEKIKIRINKKRIEPPYNSKWPQRVPSEKTLRKKYYPDDFFEKKTNERDFLDIWSSVMYNFGTMGDFGNYVINSRVNYWSNRRLNDKKVNPKILFDKFTKTLNRKQRKLLQKATNPFFGIDMSQLLASVKIISSKSDKSNDTDKTKGKKINHKLEMRKAYDDFVKSLSPKKKKMFTEEVKPFLDDRGEINDPLEQFDTGLAQRWTFNRVVQLGWNQGLHGRFDRYVNYNRIDRSEHKAERIGKKYQWIALHELLARISDNFEFKEESQSYRIGKYEGPWQLSVRDIDPSCILKEFPVTKQEGIPKFNNYEKQTKYNAWNNKKSDTTWLKESRDIPKSKQIIEFTDDEGNQWVVLEGFIEWQNETPPEHEKFDISNRRLWYMTKSYLLKEQNKNKVFRWAKQQQFMGRWMPESNEFYNVYLGEYPWSPVFLYHYIPYYHHNGWTTGERNKKIPAKVLITDDHYLSSGSSRDCSTKDAISVKLPAKFIVDRMKLVQTYMDGRFFNKNGEIVVFDPTVFNENISKLLLIRKDKLCNFLKSKGYAIFWTFLGEKSMIGGRVIGQPHGWLEINGAYTLNNRNKIIGKKRTNFKK